MMWIGPTEKDKQEAADWKEYINTPLAAEEEEFLYKKKFYQIKWTVNEWRRDKRTGVISPAPRSDYYKSLDAGWKDGQLGG